MKSGIHFEALIYSLLWVAVAIAGAILIDWRAGLALSVGLFLIVMPTSALILSKTGNFATERTVRWGILAVAALVAASVADLSG